MALGKNIFAGILENLGKAMSSYGVGELQQKRDLELAKLRAAQPDPLKTIAAKFLADQGIGAEALDANIPTPPAPAPGTPGGGLTGVINKDMASQGYPVAPNTNGNGFGNFQAPDGRIFFAGSEQEALALQAKGARRIN